MYTGIHYSDNLVFQISFDYKKKKIFFFFRILFFNFFFFFYLLKFFFFFSLKKKKNKNIKRKRRNTKKNVITRKNNDINIGINNGNENKYLSTSSISTSPLNIIFQGLTSPPPPPPPPPSHPDVERSKNDYLTDANL